MKVLIVDDDQLCRRVLRQMIVSHGNHQVIEAADGMEAFAAVEHPLHGIEVMFLDIAMPGMDGLDVLRLMRDMPGLKTLPVVLCTSSNDRTNVIRAAQLGVQHYLVKPAKAELVHQRLTTIETEYYGPRPKAAGSR